MNCESNDYLKKLWRGGSFQINQKLLDSLAPIDGSFGAYKEAVGHCEAGQAIGVKPKVS